MDYSRGVMIGAMEEACETYSGRAVDSMLLEILFGRKLNERNMVRVPPTSFDQWETFIANNGFSDRVTAHLSHEDGAIYLRFAGEPKPECETTLDLPSTNPKNSGDVPAKSSPFVFDTLPR